MLGAPQTRGRVEGILSLLSFGAKVDFETREGKTALMEACTAGLDDAVGALLDNEASMDMESRDAYTPLMYAVLAERTSTVQLLVRRGAFLDRESSKGQTALKLARTPPLMPYPSLSPPIPLLFASLTPPYAFRAKSEV